MFIFRLIKEHRAFWKKENGRVVIWVAVVILVVISGAVGFILASNEPRVVKVTPAPSEVPAGADDSKIAKSAKVEWEYEYRMCGHSVHLSCMADDNITGLTFSQLQAEYPDARIISFEPDRIALKMSFECYCPRHYILKRYGEGLAVFRTTLGTDEQEKYRELNIRLSDINAEEREVLETGKIFESLDNLDNYLESPDTLESSDTPENPNTPENPDIIEDSDI